MGSTAAGKFAKSYFGSLLKQVIQAFQESPNSLEIIYAIRFCFEACNENTLLAGVQLKILEPAGEVTCRRCGLEFSVQQLYEICDCGSASLAIWGSTQHQGNGA